MTGQLPLGLRWPSGQRFETWVASTRDTVTVPLLRAVATGADAAWPYLVGGEGSGRTHLLLATCAAAHAGKRAAQYLSLAKLGGGAAPALRGIGGGDLLALDDIDAMAGDDAAERALFDLYNRCRAESTTLVFAAGGAAAQVGFRLPDLVSRLAACTQLSLHPLDEGERRDVLRFRAKQRGIELDDGVLDWLFARSRRDLGSLIAVLDRIDVAALAAKRRVTIPFLRELLVSDGATERS